MPENKKRLIFIFLDGVGVGDPADKNPFYAAKTEFLPFYEGNLYLPDNTPVKKIDTLLGVEGIPQSASGQAALYTGENVPELLGQHKGSYPNRLMRKVIKEKNILSRLKDRGLKAPVFLRTGIFKSSLPANFIFPRSFPTNSNGACPSPPA
jgi:hypothetical protein